MKRDPFWDKGGGPLSLKRMDNVLFVVEDLEAVKAFFIELDKFHTPKPVRHGPVKTPLNVLGIRRVMFGVEHLDEILARMRAHGSELIGEMQYGDAYRLAYIRGPEGILVGLAEELRKASPRRGKVAARAKAVPRSKSAVRRKVARKG